MSVSIGPWNPATESFEEYNDRRNKTAQARETFSGLMVDRYAIGVEQDRYEDSMLHAYVLCLDCWQKPPGLVDPRAMVLTGENLAWLVPGNIDLTLGAPMVEIITAILKHETERHGV